VRILYILTTLGVGGAEKQVVGLAERMAAQGHAVTLLTLKHADEEWPVKLPAMRLNLPKTLPGILRGLGFARNFVAAFRPDLLHSHTFPANLFTRLLALRLRFGGKAPTVVNTIHNVHEGGWHRMALYAVTDPLVDKVTAVSEAAARRFVRLRAVPQRKMQVLTNGIDTEAFAPDGARRRQTRMLMHTPLRAANQFVWLAVGRLAPAKDYPNLLSAFARVRSAFPDCCLWIAGEGDASGFDRLQSGESGVRFLGLRRDVAALLDAADGFCPCLGLGGDAAGAWRGDGDAKAGGGDRCWRSARARRRDRLPRASRG
jgi:glycosyltransferase involved in cell wall biosynthesis